MSSDVKFQGVAWQLLSRILSNYAPDAVGLQAVQSIPQLVINCD
jgi:hypothetical protein